MMKGKGLMAVALVAALATAPAAQADQLSEEIMDANKVSPYAMMLDAFIGRPLMLGATGLGFATFLVSTPFTFVGGTTGDVWDSLVVTPASSTFVRCLGCTPVQHERFAAERATARATEAANPKE